MCFRNPISFLIVSSKSQYEHRFKIWGLRKNLKRKERDVVLDAVEKRTRLGQVSQLTLNGAAIDGKRIARELTRRGMAQALVPSLESTKFLYPKEYWLISPSFKFSAW